MDPIVHHSVVRSYARQARIYDRIFKNYLDGTLGTALDLMELTGAETILDVACGTGELERKILERFPRQNIEGIDLSEEMLRQARKKLSNFSHLNWVCADSRHLPFSDNRFDIVISCSAFHYMREPQKVLNEAARVLKPGGKLIIIDWCYDFLFGKMYHRFRRLFFPSHYRVYRLAELQDMMREAGLTPTHSETFSVQFTWRMMGVVSVK